MKLAIITGATRGIGAAAASTFQKNNWQVICLSRKKPQDDTIKHVQVDLADFDIKEIESSLITDLQHAEVISFIHCAGITASDSIENIEEKDLKMMMAVNVFSAIKLIHFLIPFMKENSSAVLVGSTLSYIGVPTTCSYIISKHALVGLMRSMTQDLAYKKIHACCVCPGFTDTEMLQELAQSRNCNVNDFRGIQLFNRFIQPQEIADLIYFCSQNPIVNGGVIQANMGQ